MIAEAVDTMLTLGWALAAWITVLAAVATIVLLAAAATGAWAWRAAWRAVRACIGLRSRQAPVSRPNPGMRGSRDAGTAPRASQAPSRPAPAWAHTEQDAA